MSAYDDVTLEVCRQEWAKLEGPDADPGFALNAEGGQCAVRLVLDLIEIVQNERAARNLRSTHSTGPA